MKKYAVMHLYQGYLARITQFSGRYSPKTNQIVPHEKIMCVCRLSLSGLLGFIDLQRAIELSKKL